MPRSSSQLIKSRTTVVGCWNWLILCMRGERNYRSAFPEFRDDNSTFPPEVMRQTIDLFHIRCFAVVGRGVRPMSLGPSQVLAKKYRLISLLGRGGMSSVWRAEHLTLNSSVAVKLIDPSVAHEPEARRRFLREAQAAAALRSPHVVQIFDYGVDGDDPYFVMELLEGESLAARLARVGRLIPSETSRIITEVCRAISRAHEAGLVHRDLKPDNIFLVRNDETEIAKVLDFGIAKVKVAGMNIEEGTQTGTMLGTPYYMSPEQAGASSSVDYRSDLWALGVVAYQCLTGSRPFAATTLGELVLTICVAPLPVPSTVGPVPPGFDAWFARATARVPDDRFQSARELAQSLKTVCRFDENLGSKSGSVTAVLGSLPSPSRGEVTSESGTMSRTSVEPEAPPTWLPTKFSTKLGWRLVFGSLIAALAMATSGALVSWRAPQEEAPKAVRHSAQSSVSNPVASVTSDRGNDKPAAQAVPPASTSAFSPTAETVTPTPNRRLPIRRHPNWQRGASPDRSRRLTPSVPPPSNPLGI